MDARGEVDVNADINMDVGGGNESDDEIQEPIPNEIQDLIPEDFEGEEIQQEIPEHEDPNAEIQLPLPDVNVEEVNANAANALVNPSTFSLVIEGHGLHLPLITEPAGHVLAWEYFLLTVAKMLRYKETYESMLKSFQHANRLFVNGNLPTGMRTFWNIVGRNDQHFQQNVVCSMCWSDLGVGKEPVVDCQCQPVQCGLDRANVHLATFFYVNLKSQIETLFRKPGIAADLMYPYTRVKQNEGAIEDVYDGTQYRYHSADEERFLHRSRNNYSLAMWADGVSPVKSANVHIVPVFIQIMELSPRARQRHSMLAALYVGPRKTSMAHFLRPVTTELETLYVDGVLWQPNPNEQRRSRFMLFIVSADSEERYTIFGMSRHNGHFGCTCCLVNGVENEEAANHTLIYPLHIEEGVEDRTNAGNRFLSELVAETGEATLGVRNIPALYPLEVDLRTAQLMEPLHLYWKGNSYRLINNFLDSDMPDHIRPADLEIIGNRVMTIRTPTKVSRRPRVLTEIRNFTGHELRNHSWHYWLPCAQDFLSAEQLRSSCLFAEFTFILHQDSILPAELDRATQLINEYRRLFQATFPANQCVYNLHLLKHSVQCVRDLGPCFVASGIWFEPLNRQVVNFITSPNDRGSQVACRMLLRQMVEGYLNNNLTPGTLHELRDLIGKETWAERPEEAVGVFIQVPDRGREGPLNHEQFIALEAASVRNINENDRIMTYKKIVKDGIIYQVDKGTTKYNNSITHVTVTHAEDIHFLGINYIISWRDGDDEHTGILGTPYRTIEMAFGTSYMHDVEKLDDYLIFVPITDVIIPGVLVEVNGSVYISRLPSRWEND